MKPTGHSSSYVCSIAWLIFPAHRTILPGSSRRKLIGRDVVLRLRQNASREIHAQTVMCVLSMWQPIRVLICMGHTQLFVIGLKNIAWPRSVPRLKVARRPHRHGMLTEFTFQDLKKYYCNV